MLFWFGVFKVTNACIYEYLEFLVSYCSVVARVVDTKENNSKACYFKNPKPKQHSFNLFNLNKTASKLLLALNSYLPSMAPPIANKLFCLIKKIEKLYPEEPHLLPVTHKRLRFCLSVPPISGLIC